MRCFVIFLYVLSLADCMVSQVEPTQGLLAGPIQPSARAKPPPERAKPPPERMAHLSTQDVLGEPVRLGKPDQQRATAVFFMSRTSKDESSDFVRRFDEKVLNGPVESVGIVDVRNYGGVTRPLTQWHLRKSASEARTRRRERREQHAVDASPTYVNRWHLLGDFDGSLFKQFDVPAEPAHPVAFVVEPSGVIRGPYSDLDALVHAVPHN